MRGYADPSAGTLVRFGYHVGGLSRKEKGLVRKLLARVAGYSASQLTRLIAQQRRAGGIRDHRKKPPARPLPTRYTVADIALLAEMDEAWGHLSGPATIELLRREFHVHGVAAGGCQRGHVEDSRTGG